VTWHKSLSWLTYFEKFQWQAVLPEYDPYEYNSFPKSLGHETYALAQQVQEMLSRLGALQTEGRIRRYWRSCRSSMQPYRLRIP
jgi:hypothetical protein